MIKGPRSRDREIFEIEGSRDREIPHSFLL